MSTHGPFPATRVLLVCALSLLASGGTARGDVVHLKGGRRLVGTVEETPEGVRVTMPGGTLTLPRDRVERIERGEDPVASVKRRVAEIAEGDVAAALALASEAEAAGLADEAGRVLGKAAAWAPDDPKVRAAVFRWSAFVRKIAADPDADARLLSAFGKGGRLHFTDHFRIAGDVDAADLRRRGELLETAYRKVCELAAKTGLDPRPLVRRLDVHVHAEHARWAAAIGRPAAGELRGLSGLYVPGDDRVYLFELSTLPEAGEARARVEEGRAGLASWAASIEGLRKQAREVAAVAEAAAAAKDEARRVEAARVLSQAESAIREQERKLAAGRADLAQFERGIAEQSERENLSATTHEACHQISFAMGICRPGQPTWLLEGLATLFEVTSRTSFVLEKPNEMRVAALRGAWDAGRTTHVRDILSDAVFLGPSADRSAAYAESWSFAWFLFRRRPADLAKLIRDGRLLAALPSSSEERLEDARRVLGDDLDALDRAWKDDVRSLLRP